MNGDHMGELEKKDAQRYRWLRREYGLGSETYLAEGIISETQLDEYIDKKLENANST